jgi:hypothetical protein
MSDKQPPTLIAKARTVAGFLRSKTNSAAKLTRRATRSFPGHDSPESIDSRSTAALHWLTISMALLANLIFVITDADGGRSAASLGSQLLVETGFTAGLAWMVRRRQNGLAEAPMITPLLLLVVLGSLAWEPIQRTFFLSGRPFEMMIMHCQKNLMLAAAVFACRTGYQRLCVLIGVSLAIFCAAITRENRVYWLVAIYGCAAVSWLILSYWTTLQARLIAGESRRIPVKWLLVGPSIPLFLLLASATGGQSVITSLRGFLPGSGGEEEMDQFSRGGVNDGDALVAGKDNISSFGPIEDAPFADDDKPSLYDVINDTYDEPAKKLKDMEQTVALPPELMAEVKARMARTEQAGREFSTLRRKAKKDDRTVKDLESHALFYVAGRVPLHLRMETYDIFDGIDWIPEALSPLSPGMGMVTTNGVPALRVPCGGRGLELHVGADTHAIKVINLRTPVIPAPLDLRSIQIDKVDRADMFGWHRDTIVKMNRKALPQMTTIQLRSECMDRERLTNHPHTNFTPVAEAKRIQLPQVSEIANVRALAEEWTRGIPGRYQQIQTICERLRETCVLDRDQHVAADSQFPVGEFLFESKRGPDYQFATAAALMLRSLGFSTRLVSGFYADPVRYDARKRCTAVHSSDVHFWLEVYLGGGTWATFEPSPGYDILAPPPGFWRRVWLTADSAGQWMRRHAIVLGIGFTLCVLGLVKRQVLNDAIVTVMWSMRPARTVRGRVLQTARLIDRRLSCSGRPRPQHLTLIRWLRQQPDLNQLSPAMTEFMSLADWAAFAEVDSESEVEKSAAEACCRKISRDLTLKNCTVRA